MLVSRSEQQLEQERGEESYPKEAMVRVEHLLICPWHYLQLLLPTCQTAHFLAASPYGDLNAREHIISELVPHFVCVRLFESDVEGFSGWKDDSCDSTSRGSVRPRPLSGSPWDEPCCLSISTQIVVFFAN